MSESNYTYRIFIERFPYKYFIEVIQGLIDNFPNKELMNDKICFNTEELYNSPNTRFLIFAGHRLPNVPSNSIIINFEQLYDGSPHAKPSYINILKNNVVWDYSQQNIEWLKSKSITNVKHLNIAYSNNMLINKNLIKNKDNKNIINTKNNIQDIDVLFCGARNPRRNALIEKVKNHPKIGKVVYESNAWGESKNNLIRRAKIVLNIHFFPTGIFEIVRVFQLLANRKCVISENSNFPDDLSFWNEGITFFNDGDELVEKIIYYLENEDKRVEMENNGYEMLIKRKWNIPI